MSHDSSTPPLKRRRRVPKFSTPLTQEQKNEYFVKERLSRAPSATAGSVRPANFDAEATEDDIQYELECYLASQHDVTHDAGYDLDLYGDADLQYLLQFLS